MIEAGPAYNTNPMRWERLMRSNLGQLAVLWMSVAASS